jgi:hypothetical protein
MMLKRKILWEPPQAAEDSPVAVDTSPEPMATESPPVRRSGNGHKSLKHRALEPHEKDKIQSQLFIPHNGMIGKDLCVDFKTQKLPGEVSIFQVTGYVTALHIRVAAGKLRVQDKRSYENFIKGHRNLWKTYDSEKYRAMRQPNQHRTPEFQAYPNQKKTA